jgi:hypothetical protein
MPAYTINEPHPTVSVNAPVHYGRGGAGNMLRAPVTTPAAGVAIPASPPKSSSTRFYSGRGGAGNAHKSAERHALSFDEEYQSALAHEKAAATGHTGRGGAGNVFHSSGSESAASRRDSASTNGSQRSGFWGRLSGHF